MNRSVLSKLKLMITGLVSRIEENKNFFKEITVDFISGKKSFTATILLEDNLLNIKYNGTEKQIPILELTEFILEECAKYPKMVLTLKERGTNVFINADIRDVKITYKSDEGLITPNIIKNTSTVNNTRNYYVRTGQADSLLKAIGIMASDGKIRNNMIRKYNQIDHFVELAENVINNLSNSYGRLTVLDCACGKSYLSFVLNYYLTEVKKIKSDFICLDIDEEVINSSKKTAKKLKYSNMTFICADIKDYTPDRNIDLVISLHACDTATDMAIASAVNWNADGLIVVPCCHKEMLDQYNIAVLDPILSYGIIRARMADVLTDGMRGLKLESMGYIVKMMEYISPLDSPKNLMITAVRGKNANSAMRSGREYKYLQKLLNIELTMDKLIKDL